MRVMLVILLLLPVAAGQVRVEDPAGDEYYSIYGAPDQPSPTRHGSIDIVELAIHDETRDDVGLRARFSGAQDTTPPTLSDRFVIFSVDGSFYVVRIAPCDDGVAALYTHWEREVPERPLGMRLTCLAGEVSGDVVDVRLPKQWLRGAGGLPAHAGSTLAGLEFQGQTVVAPTPIGNLVYAVDTTDPADALPFTFTVTPEGTGDIGIVSAVPLRSSNGGPDTIVYNITLNDLANRDRVVALHVEGAPADWEVRVPSRVRVPGQESREVPVIVSTRSAHAHGTTQTFRVVAHDLEKPDSGAAIELGIHYLAVPQLAGHHSTLHVHAVAEGGAYHVPGVTGQAFAIWMNTRDEEEGTTSEPVTTGARGTRHGQGAQWFIPMDPALLIGLDFDPRGVGRLESTLVADSDLPIETTLYADFLHCHVEQPTPRQADPASCRGEWRVLASGGPLALQVPVQGEMPIDLPLMTTPEADLVPFIEGSNVALEVTLIRAASSAGMLVGRWPGLQADQTRMSLPLLEYQDPADAAFQDVGSVHMVAAEQSLKSANPGQTVWFPFTLHNEGAPQRLRLDVFGQRSDWAAPHPATAFTLLAGDAADVAFSITVPLEARSEDRATLFAMAESTDDPAIATLSPIGVLVVDEPVPDEHAPAFAASQDKRTPLPTVLAALALALCGRRARP